jgi:predicted MPP superfamily phosphohydrolase
VGEILAGLRAPDGVLAVLGNHDAGVFSRTRHRPDARRIDFLVGELGKAGARVLENEALVVSRGEDRMRVVGLGDLWCRRFEPRRVLPAEPRLPTVALSHNPDTAPELSRLGCDLILSGHTHGGQVSIPLIGPPMLPVRRKDLAAGLHRLGEDPDAPDEEAPAYVYVNRGVGWLRRIRFRVRPEVTVLRLRPA